MTPKQHRFVEEYLIDLNATQAAIRAGYGSKRADEIGYENLRKPEVAEAIAEAQRKRAERLELTADAVLRELATIGFTTLDEISAGLSPVKVADKRAALVDIARHLGMFVDKHEVKGSLTLEQLVLQSFSGTGAAARQIEKAAQGG